MAYQKKNENGGNISYLENLLFVGVCIRKIKLV